MSSMERDKAYLSCIFLFFLNVGRKVDELGNMDHPTPGQILTKLIGIKRRLARKYLNLQDSFEYIQGLF